jgi:hypothetical protein
MQAVQCVRKVPYTTCQQIVEPKTIICPVTVQKQVTEIKTICVPKTICKQVPVEVCVRVPVTTYCEPAVLPSLQSVVASAPSQLPITTVPPCDPCDARHPLFGRRLGSLLH